MLSRNQIQRKKVKPRRIIRKGEIITCTVSEVSEGGLEVTTTGGLSAFVRRSDLSRDRSEQRPDRFAVGEKVDAKVVNFDASNRRISLSIKAKEIDEEKQAMKDYGSSDSGASLGDILGAALREREEQSAANDEESDKETNTTDTDNSEEKDSSD